MPRVVHSPGQKHFCEHECPGLTEAAAVAIATQSPTKAAGEVAATAIAAPSPAKPAGVAGVPSVAGPTPRKVPAPTASMSPAPPTAKVAKAPASPPAPAPEAPSKGPQPQADAAELVQSILLGTKNNAAAAASKSGFADIRSFARMIDRQGNTRPALGPAKSAAPSQPTTRGALRRAGKYSADAAAGA